MMTIFLDIDFLYYYALQQILCTLLMLYIYEKTSIYIKIAYLLD